MKKLVLVVAALLGTGGGVAELESDGGWAARPRRFPGGPRRFLLVPARFHDRLIPELLPSNLHHLLARFPVDPIGAGEDVGKQVNL